MKNNAVNILNRYHHIAIVGVLLIAVSGCGTTAPSRFYALTSLASSDNPAHHVSNAYAVSVEVGPVTLPKYLDRPQIITRSSPNIIQPADFDRWAEPLGDGVLRVVVENLSQLLWKDGIAVYFWQATEPTDYRVSINISRFDGQLGGKVILVASWTLNSRDNKTLLQKRSIITEATGQSGYEAMVFAESRALAALSRELAADICSLLNNKACGNHKQKQ